MKLGRKILLMLLAIFATTVVAAGIYLTTTYNYATGELSKTFRASKATSGNSKAIQQTKPITILLMGVDTGSKERKETWEGNSDTMILVTVNPKTKKTTMTSLERDLLTDIEGSGEAKLNSAYAEGGADLAISTIQKVLDIDIDYYALINMQGMIDLVDAVGGIEVTNHFDFPISIAENEPEFQAKVEPGTHKINGEQALVYSRMRYDDPDGDYGRQKRQREVIQKVVAKLLKMDSIGSYKKILSAVSSNVQTSIDLGDTNTLRSLMGYSDALKKRIFLRCKIVSRRKLVRKKSLNLILRLVWFSMVLVALTMAQMILLIPKETWLRVKYLQIMRPGHLRQQVVDR